MNRSRLDMNTANDKTPTTAVTLRLSTSPPRVVSLISGLTITHHPPVRPEIQLTRYPCHHGQHRTSYLLDRPHPGHRRGEVGAAGDPRGLPRRPQVRRDGAPYRRPARHARGPAPHPGRRRGPGKAAVQRAPGPFRVPPD